MTSELAGLVSVPSLGAELEAVSLLTAVVVTSAGAFDVGGEAAVVGAGGGAAEVTGSRPVEVAGLCVVESVVTTGSDSLGLVCPHASVKDRSVLVYEIVFMIFRGEYRRRLGNA